MPGQYGADRMADGTGGPGFQGDDIAVSASHRQVSLRIMATTDLHAHLLPFDYFTDRPCPHLGLARTAALIGRLRQAQPNNLLLDNGDMLQGSPLGDYVAAAHLPHDEGAHPTIAAMNALRYDGAGLGNHDFNFGLRFLRRVMGGANFPFAVSNAQPQGGPDFSPWLLLTRQLRDAQGSSHQIRIGILGFVPPQTAEWDQALKGKLDCHDIIEAARHHLPALRAAGADLVIALAHSGIGPADCAPRMEHAATALAGIEGIDVVIAGHTHQVFPGPDFQPAPGVDPERGSLQGKPAVMAGFGGAHLGVIDLDLLPPGAAPDTGADGRWRMTGFHSRCIAVDPADEAEQAITRPALKAHRATRRHFRRRIGHSDTPLNSFFTLIGHDRGLKLVAQAQRWHLRHALRGTALQHLPLLSAVSPFRAGGRAGPHFYTNVPAGSLTLRSLADLYLFPNHMVAVQLDGRAVRNWLERAAGIFNRIQPGQPGQQLLNPHFPPYSFDVIDGLTWQIDLTAPPLYAADGTQLEIGGPGRIRDLRHNGQPVTDETPFVMATNSYRLSSCGLFAPVAAAGRVVMNQTLLTREIVHSYLRRRRSIDLPPGSGWGFAAAGGAGLVLDTSPLAVDHLDDLNAHRPSAAPVTFNGLTESGFARMCFIV